ncbi:hypothetical protein C8R45DRAFT_1115491 [Mycena sanguinolenta]|nr:hypothetical protein C8R45DRAFT_1115491 [Mycena sanguinolenta]
MPLPPWKPPPEAEKYLEYSADRQHVRCVACQKEGNGKLGKSIQVKTSLKGHLQNSQHLSCIKNYEARLAAEADGHARLSAVYDAPAAGDYTEICLSPDAGVPAMLPDMLTPMDIDEYTIAQMAEQLGQTQFPEETESEDEPVFDGVVDVDEEEACFDMNSLENSEYYPYPDKTTMLLDVLDNLPRCRFTGAQLSLVIHFAKSLGAPNVPSLKGLRRIQKELHLKCGKEPVKVNSAMGNILFMNDLRESIANDFANPLVAPHLQLYPEEVESDISENWQSERWREYSPEQLTPMFAKGYKRFWIEELAQTCDGKFVIPHTWIKRGGVLTTDAQVVTRTADERWNLTGEERTIEAESLEFDFRDIVAQFGEQLTWTEDSNPPVMPNKMRDLVADDEDLFVVMVSPWADDVSGNKSKQYNKHMNVYAQNGCLPGRLLQQEFHMHYVSTSPHASSAEQFAALRDHIKATETTPVRAYNAATQRPCRIILRAPGLPADNPQQSEEASHMGSDANYPCRKCHWGGTQKQKETCTIYHDCHLAGIARNATEIREELQTQLQLATKGNSEAIKARQTVSGTKDKMTQYWIGKLLARYEAMRTANPRRNTQDISQELQSWLSEQPGDKMNPLLDLTGLDPSQDTPVELLHTVLLGVIKYIWHLMNTTKWKDEDRHLLAIRLQSTDLSGLTVPPLRASYMMQYRNNLIGKHFKTLMQILAFHVDDIASPEQLKLIVAAGNLGARLWVPVINDLESYLPDLEIAIANLLDAFDIVDPLRIIVKIKLHLLTHIPVDIRRFGPAIRFSTEIFEAFNSVFRMCSINSNHIAPSRDISRKFASMDRVKHLLSGGYWRNIGAKSWSQAGAAVRRVVEDDPVFQRHLGWVSSKPVAPGSIRLTSVKKQPPLQWHTTEASKHWSLGADPQPDSLWRQGQYVTTVSGDHVPKSGWVFAKATTGKPIFGRVAEILVGEKAVVTLEQFLCAEQRHPDLDWPVARRPRGADITTGNIKTHVVLEASALQFIFSVQHDCRQGKCQPVVIGKHFQEREETMLDRELIKHSDDDNFIINMAALHNFTELVKVLPTRLTKLEYLHADREKFHHECATKANEARVKKRARTAAKRRATAAEKKKQAEDAAAAAVRAEELAADAEAAVMEQRDPEPEEGDEDEGQGSENEGREGGNNRGRSSDSEGQDDSGPDSSDSEDDYSPSGAHRSGAGNRGGKRPATKKRKRQ